MDQRPRRHARASPALSACSNRFKSAKSVSTGEVIALHHDLATIQVYEETNGLRPGEPLYGTGSPLSVLLGPGLLANTYDGLQRPLAVMRDQQGIYLQRGSQADALPSRERGASHRVRKQASSVDPAVCWARSQKLR